ncbi:MAG: hypothetical protein FWE01_03065 [Firmicutes bacterium]|nr:hypothetical protein [Bacillota bacterium]
MSKIKKTLKPDQDIKKITLENVNVTIETKEPEIKKPSNFKSNIKKVWTLMKLQFKSRIAMPKNRDAKTIAKYTVALLAVLGILGGLIFVYYSFANQFITDNPNTNLGHEFLIFTILAFMILQLFFMIPTLIRVLDVNNDRELLLKLPVSHKQIYLSKVIVTYIMEVLFATVILLPILIAYGVASNMHWGFFFYIPVILVFIPVIPFFLANVVLFPIAKLINFLRSRTLLTSIGYLVLLVTFIILYMQIIEQIMTAATDSANFEATLRDNAGLIQNIASWFWPQRIYADLFGTSLQTNILSLVLILGASFVLLVASYYIGAWNFKKTYQEERISYFSINRKPSFKKCPSWLATTKKDCLNIFRSSNYTFQFLLIVVITPILVFYVNRIAMFSAAQTFQGTQDTYAASGMIFGISILVMFILLPLAASFAASNISREGHNLYHTKLIPVHFRKQLLIKSLIVFIPILLSIILSVGLMMIPYQPLAMSEATFNVSSIDAFWIFGIATLMTMGYIALGTYLDLKNPLCNQVGGAELTKSTASVNTVMVIGVVVGALMGVLAVFGAFYNFLQLGPSWIGNLATMGRHTRPIFASIAIIFAVAAVTLLLVHGPKQYRKLEAV